MSLRLTRLASVASVTGLALTALSATGPAAAATGAGDPAPATTPIKHVIVIIGENHTLKNPPATGNLMTLFDFGHPDFATLRLPAPRQPGPAVAQIPAAGNSRS